MDKKKNNWLRFGEWVAARRKGQGLTQPDLGKLLGMDRQQIYRIEHGGSTKRSTVIRLAEALKAETTEALDIAFGIADRDANGPAALAIRILAKQTAQVVKDFLDLPPEGRAHALEMMAKLEGVNDEELESMRHVENVPGAEVKQKPSDLTLVTDKTKPRSR